MLSIVLIVLSAIATLVYLRMVRHDAYERGYMVGHADAARKLQDAMDRCTPPF